MNPEVIPPLSSPSLFPFRRDPETGLEVGRIYKFTPEGRIDYKSMIDKKFLYVANEYKDKVVKEQGKPIEEIDVFLVKDEWLRIKMGGINQLANLRGYRSLEYDLVTATDGKAACVCRMEFIGNCESDNLPFICSAMASATLRSVDVNFTPFLETFAENRSFARCVKRALQINILSDIEVGGDSKKVATNSVSDGDDEQSSSNASNNKSPVGFNPCDLLAQRCAAQKKPISFDSLKAAAIKLNLETPITDSRRIKADPSSWTGFNSIQPIDAELLLGKLEEKERGLKRD